MHGGPSCAILSRMTGRLPFDPEKTAAARAARAAGGGGTGGGDGGSPLTVSQLAGRISGALAAGFGGPVRVIGEISGFRERTHWYFDLKDANAVVNCAMFATAARRARFGPRNGQEVVATGRVEFYDKQGRVTLIVEKLEPVGAGALELAFRALCEELRALGWFEESRKRPIPAHPRRIGVVTSRSGAALQDVLDTMRRRNPAVGAALVDARVQGEGAAAEVAAAIRWLDANRARLGLDAILVTRGGGSMEDLWAFNERVVAEAIVRSSLPVVAAIGHETDTTIAELVADLRCATPTQAAMRLCPDRGAMLEQLDSLGARLAGAASRVLQERRHVESLGRQLRLTMTGRVSRMSRAIERLSGRLESHRPAALQARRAAKVEGLEKRLAAAAKGEVERHRARLTAISRQLAAVGPQSVLKRGYSYTMREDGTLVKGVSDVRSGDVISTQVADGRIRSVVEPEGAKGGRASEPAGPPVSPMPRPRRGGGGGGKTGADQPGLFGGG